MKFKKITVALAAAVLTFSLSFSAYADILPNFNQVNVYDENTYEDVSRNEWYYYYVGFAYEYGIMSGSAPGYFVPSGSITLAEIITVAARLNAAYYGNSISARRTSLDRGNDAMSWFAPYVIYAAENGIITPTEFSGRYWYPASRAEIAHILYMALPGSYDKINDISPIPDVSSANQYYAEILTMYESGVLTGSDEYGTFYPDTDVLRCEAAAMVSRVVNTDLRVNFKLNENKPYKTCGYSWQYPDYGKTFRLNIDISYYDYNYFASKARTYDYAAYARDAADVTAVTMVADSLRNIAVESGFTSEYDIVSFIAAFVQALEYQEDLAYKGYREYPKYPIETLFEQGGDCEDTAVLLAKLLKTLGFGAVLLESKDHMAVGVQTSGRGNLSYDGNEYYYIETTEPRWRVGEVPDDMVGVNMEVIYI